MKKRLLNYLKSELLRLCNRVDLDATYSNTKYRCGLLLSRDEIIELSNLRPLDRQIRLKQLISIHLNGSFDNWDADKWIVHEWGGIKRFKIDNTEKYQNRITDFSDNLLNGHTVNLDCISSLSKIASFVNPDNYFVFDSRVTYALNGLILNYKINNQKETVKFFPIPSAQGGRDTRMVALIQQKTPNAAFYTRTESYNEYNQVILSLSVLLDNKYPPCWVEMLLFELGKTRGEIDRMFFQNQDNTLKPLNKHYTISTASKEHSIIELTDGEKKYNRIMEKGYTIIVDGLEFYLFVGKDSQKAYCEVFSPKCQYVKEMELIQNGFMKRGGGKTYYIKEFNNDAIEQAISFMNEIKKLFIH